MSYDVFRRANGVGCSLYIGGFVSASNKYVYRYINNSCEIYAGGVKTGGVEMLKVDTS